MSVISTVSSPDPAALVRYQRVLDSLSKQILPQGQQAENWSRISQKRGLMVSVLGRRDSVSIRGFNVLAGVTIQPDEGSQWWTVGGGVPDGSFILFRSNESTIEIMTDYTSSESVWHARLRCGGVVASTCFELIVALLGDFQFDKKTLGWFLSSGTAGPRRSWDRRIRPLPPNSCLSIQRSGSELSLREHQNEQPRYFTEEIDAGILANALSETLSSYAYGDKHWLLALSGGYDSRAMLHGTRHLENVTCVTWVDQDLVDRPDSDLEVARKLAEKAGRKHIVKILHRPKDSEALDQAARRFVRYSDGRVDNVFAYLDGMQIWDELSELKAVGLLRGDELFGSSYATTESRIMHNMRLSTFSDYQSSREQKTLFGLYSHEVPVGLRKRTGESSAHWRWRLRATYELPTIYSALNSIRSRFLTCSCPLLSRQLVDMAGSMPSRDHDDRALYKKVVASMYPDVPIASTPSVLNRANFLAMPQTTELLLDHLNGSFAKELLGGRCRASAIESVAGVRDKQAAMESGVPILPSKRTYIPQWAKRTKHQFKSLPGVDLPTLAMRSYLAEIIRQEMLATARAGNISRMRDSRAIA